MSRKVILIIGFILLVIVVGLLISRSNNDTASTPTPAATTTPVSGLKTYTSKALGIQFQYNATPPPGGVISVKETGNKVYVYAGNVPENGQSVEVFQKPASESFEASIRRQILAGFPAAPTCKITVSPSNIIGGYQVAEITYPAPTNTNDPFFVNATMCNEKYDKTNGLRYFLFDPQKPTEFAFLNIGQYPIIAHDNVTWQDTLRFTK